jgi:SNF2 family DNA or RNA helicase
MLTIKDLRPKQYEGINFIIGGYASLLLADVGTGKTVMTLTALDDLIFEKGVIDRVLVLAPKRVATDVWEQEAREWEHLKHLSISVIAGKPEKKRKEIIANPYAQIVVLNYELLIWLMETYPKPPFDCLVCDEIDKLKDRTSQRFTGKKLKGKIIHEGIKKYREGFNTVIGLTGTPASNGLLDLWAQAFIVDGGASLGRSFNKYQREYFYPTDYTQRNWEVLPTYEEKIYNKLAPIVFRIERDDSIPPVVETPPRYVDMPSGVLKMYRKFERDLLVYIDEHKVELESPNAATGYGRLREIASGFSYVGEDPRLFARRNDKLAVWHHYEKYKELDSLISELQGQQLMIIYHFKEQLAELRKRYPDLEYLGGGISNSDARDTINCWNSGKLKLLALHPLSAGHGLNMQKSHANHICMITLPDSAGLFEQVIGRLRRTGNDAESIFVHTILARNTVDEDRWKVVHGKIKTQHDLLDAMRERCSR